MTGIKADSKPFPRVTSKGGLQPFLVSTDDFDNQELQLQVRGRIGSRRAMGKGMIFFDLVHENTANGNGEGVMRLECLLQKKGLASLSLPQVKEMTPLIKLGDVVQVRGFLDETRACYIVEPLTMKTIEAWKDKHGPGQGGDYNLDWPMKEPSNAADASVDMDPEQPLVSLDDLCKYWVNTKGRCYQALGCSKIHPPLSQLAYYRTAWIENREKERAEASHLEGDLHDPHEKINKAARARIFSDWLTQTYGLEALKKGGGVCDVAGGHGDISVRLWTDYGVPCTIIDPRQVDFKRRLKKQVEVKGWKGITRITCEMCVGRRKGKVAAVASSGQRSTSEEEEVDDEMMTMNEEEIKLQKALEECSLIFGMHPDQATDAIVDVSYKYEKPFAVVPCCVFAREFSQRQLPSGGPVETYEQLIEYLQAKPSIGTAGVMRHFLPFKGRNQVLYRLPEGEALPPHKVPKLEIEA